MNLKVNVAALVKVLVDLTKKGGGYGGIDFKFDVKPPESYIASEVKKFEVDK